MHFKSISEYHLSDFFSFRNWDAIGVQLEMDSSTEQDSFI